MPPKCDFSMRQSKSHQNFGDQSYYPTVSHVDTTTTSCGSQVVLATSSKTAMSTTSQIAPSCLLPVAPSNVCESQPVVSKCSGTSLVASTACQVAPKKCRKCGCSKRESCAPSKGASSSRPPRPPKVVQSQTACTPASITNINLQKAGKVSRSEANRRKHCKDSLYKALFCDYHDPNGKSKSASDLTALSADKKTRRVNSVSKVHSARANFHLAEIRTQSHLRLAQSLNRTLGPGLTGLKNFISSRTLLDDDQPERLIQFIDFFIECDGMRYLGILEQIEIVYEERCKTKLTLEENATGLRCRLLKIAEIQSVCQERSLKKFNYPEQLENHFKMLVMRINYKWKIDAFKRVGD